MTAPDLDRLRARAAELRAAGHDGLAAEYDTIAGEIAVEAAGELDPAPRPAKVQLDRAALAHMTPAEIDQARRDGHLDALLGRPVAPAPPTRTADGKPIFAGSADGGPRGTTPSTAGQVGLDELRAMTPAEQARAFAAGRLDDLRRYGPTARP